ncbi:MAG: DegT/DnrJ/EryC1/StrS aminotransferase family protein [Oligoflexia bacterium]|nr:DegT/DnrJ/EryC1/StrS aminotransferase family protein [Oligoflexia bacterium]
MKNSSLAIDGGTPLRTKPLPGWPFFDAAAQERVSNCLASGKVSYWTGVEGREFEREFAYAQECEFAVALANASVGLELALHILEIGPGDEVITSPRTFIASASSVVLRGAVPIMADVDRDSQNISADSIAKVLTPRTKAIIAVHLAGWPCEMGPILQLANKHNLRVIEDCAQAQGAYYRGRPVGSLGDVGVFSFCQDKLMTTGGEGSMLTTNNAALWRKAWAYKDHGKDFDAVYKRAHPPGFKWLHESFGTNWRLTEMQSALGRYFLQKIPDWVRTRQEHARKLHSTFAKFECLRQIEVPEHIKHCYYRVYAFVRPERLKPGWTRDRIMTAIAAEGIPCATGSCSEIYLEKCFDLLPQSRPPERLPNAKELGETGLAFLVHPTLTAADIEDSCRAVEKVLSFASV